MQKSSRLWTLQFIIIIVLTFLFFLCLQMLTAGFPVYITQLYNNPTEGGLMTTSFMLAAIFTRPIIGILIHKMNIKKMLGMTLIFVLLTMLATFGHQSIPFIIVIRLLQGASFGLVTTLLATLATNLIPNDRLGEGIGYFGMATSLGTTLGPMVALALIHSSSFHTLLYYTAGISCFAFISSLFIKRTIQEQPLDKFKSKTSVWEYAFDKKALLPSFLVFLFYLTFSGVVNFINGLGHEAHLGGEVSLFFLVNAIMMVLVRPFSGRIYDTMGHKFLIYPASLFGIVGLLLIGYSHHLLMFMIAAAFYGVAYGVMQPTFQAWAVSRVAEDKKPTANAMAFSFMDLGMALGAASLGEVATFTNYHRMYSYSSIIVMLLFLIYLGSQIMFKGLIKRNKENVA